MTLLLIPGAHWYASHRADPRAIRLYLNHYSARRYADGRPRRQFVAPGEAMVLLTPAADALLVWHRGKPEWRLDHQCGVCCAVFRNEGPYRASTLIREAEQLAWARWPGERLFTYVAPQQVRTGQTGQTPGFCFLAARWKHVRRPDGTVYRSKAGLLLFEKWPPGGRRRERLPVEREEGEPCG